MKIHLGSGNNYLETYVNVELPENKHLKADMYADIRELDFEPGSISEIVICHVFEHFDRPTALALLLKWNRWLKFNGKLTIEVPDFEANINSFLNSGASYQYKQKILRHLFGSHEADWAIHRDGWYSEKFQTVLDIFGFEIKNTSPTFSIGGPHQPLFDIRVEATKKKDISKSLSIAIAKNVFRWSLLSHEEWLMSIWMEKFLDLTKNIHNEEATNNLILIFSKDRAAQLDCMLGTLYQNCADIYQADVKVLYKCSNSIYNTQYMRLADYYPDVEFIKETDFRNNLIYFLSGYDFCLLSVDDCIYTGDFVLNDAVDLLKQSEERIGVSLRLGKNITHSYMADVPQSIPEFLEMGDYLEFNWQNGEYDFGYPLEVSSSVYRTDDLLNVLMRVPFDNPNTMEMMLERHKSILEDRPKLVCYQESVAFCNPLNVVQNTFRNRCGNVSAEIIGKAFYEGFRINIEPLKGVVIRSPHQEVDFVFSNPNLVTENPELSIIIVTYNGIDNLRECLTSVFRNTNCTYELILIDNKKDSESSQYAQRFPKLKLIQNEANVGPAEGRNQGLRIATGKYIAFLDDDVVVSRNWDSKFIEHFIQHPEVFMIGPRSNWANGLQYIRNAVYSNICEYEQFAHSFGKYDKGLIPTISLISMCLFMRKEVVDVIGAMDTSFSINGGYEDTDYTLRAQLAKLNPAIAKNIFIHHFGGPTKDGNVEYNNNRDKAWGVFKEKWGLPSDVSVDMTVLDSKEIIEKEWNIDQLFIPL